MFLHMSVILFTGRGGSTWAGIPTWQVHPLDRYTPQAGTPLGRYTPPRRYTPAGTSPTPGQVHPPGRYTPQEGTPPARYSPPQQVHPPAMHAGIRSTSGQYASYWNAFLLTSQICQWHCVVKCKNESELAGLFHMTFTTKHRLSICLLLELDATWSMTPLTYKCLLLKYDLHISTHNNVLALNLWSFPPLSNCSRQSHELNIKTLTITKGSRLANYPCE